MEKQLKKRWVKVLKAIKASGLSKAHIRRQVKLSKTTIYCYASKEGASPRYPQYVTEETTCKLELYLKVHLDNIENEAS